jgi:hypothetical protein
MIVASQKIMIVRHAEKPSDDGTIVGVTTAGVQNPEELVVRGWQRSGALARFFAPLGGPPRDPKLATPQAIYASAVAHHSNSLRPQHTVLELSLLIDLPLTLDFAKGEEAALAARLAGLDTPTLVAWEHEAIPAIVNGVVGNATSCPQTWMGTRFDLVWVLDRADQSPNWVFSQVPQMLLSGDSASPIPF